MLQFIEAKWFKQANLWQSKWLTNASLPTTLTLKIYSHKSKLWRRSITKILWNCMMFSRPATTCTLSLNCVTQISMAIWNKEKNWVKMKHAISWSRSWKVSSISTDKISFIVIWSLRTFYSKARSAKSVTSALPKM